MTSPELYKVELVNGAQRLLPEVLIANLNKEVGGKVMSIKIPSAAAGSYRLMVKKIENLDDAVHEDKKKAREAGRQTVVAGRQAGKGHQQAGDKPAKDRTKSASKKETEGSGGARGTTYFVNPYTGEILGDSQSDKSFISRLMTNMFSLHRWLLLDKIEAPLFGELPNRKLGSYITGTATILFTFGVFTGIVIWFPKKIRGWKQGLKIKWDGNWKRINHDLHNSLGLYSCVILLLMGLTGPQWSFPWYRDGLKKSLGTYESADAIKPRSPQSIRSTNEHKTMLLTDYLHIADKQLNYVGDYTVNIPSDPEDAVNISKNRSGFFAPAAADRIVIDQYSGNVLQTAVFSDKPLNERISGSIKALHVGDVYGKFSKIIYFIACLIATSLPLTGTLIWINKLKVKPKKKNRNALAVSMP